MQRLSAKIAESSSVKSFRRIHQESSEMFNEFSSKNDNYEKKKKMTSHHKKHHLNKYKSKKKKNFVSE